MIALLRGSVAARGADHVVIDVGGVGYLVHTPAPLAAALPAEVEHTLHVATIVREDAITLYGFASPEARDTFDILRDVNGIGPKHALGLLSHLLPEVLVQAIEADDLAVLVRVPGIGRKTASRLCLELKGKLPKSFHPTPARAAPDDPLPLALARLDFRKTEIDLALSSDDVPAQGDAPLEVRLRTAIGLLSRQK